MSVVLLNTPMAPDKQQNKSRQYSRLPISATIIAFNEEQRIEDCLQSISDLVKQIVVVDSGSKDRTREIAHSFGADVHITNWLGYGPQKRRAEELCRYDWILNLDADERISPQLAIEIREAFTRNEPDADAYKFRIVDQFPHESRPASWAFGYRRIRLYNFRKGRFLDSLVHDDVIMNADAKVGELDGPVPHVSIENLSAAVTKFNRYTDLQAEDLRLRGRHISRRRVVTEFPVAFFKSYFLRRRFLYGTRGFIYSLAYAHMRFLRVAKAFEGQEDPND